MPADAVVVVIFGAVGFDVDAVVVVVVVAAAD